MNKKFFSTLFISFLLLITLKSNIVNAIPQIYTNISKQGIYNVSDYVFPQNIKGTVKNISNKDNLVLLLLDENQLVIQSIHLPPLSKDYALLPLKSNYKIVLIGKGTLSYS